VQEGQAEIRDGGGVTGDASRRIPGAQYRLPDVGFSMNRFDFFTEALEEASQSPSRLTARTF
jgi:hypothetical protein